MRSVRLARKRLASISSPDHRTRPKLGPIAAATPSAINHQRRSLTTSYNGNAGVIEGVWMFIRHGDRTPTRPMSPENRREEEAAFWVSRLPVPNSWQVLKDFSTHFPIHTDGQFFELKRNPYGFLTEKGLHQLNEHGKRFRARYLRHGLQESERGLSFEQMWSVKAYSTNYLRTVLSVQSFLSGLFDVSRGLPDSSQPGIRQVDPNQPKEYWPESSTDTGSSPRSSHGPPIASVIVRDIQEDPLNAFERYPDLVERLSMEVMSSAAFRYYDGKAAPLAARLASHLPGLVKDRTSDYAAMSPSGINWIEAADHFICSSSHDLPLAQFSDHKTDPQTEVTLQALSHPTLAHLSWRFRQWYNNKALLATVAAPPLREILHQIETTSQDRSSSRRPFVVYSCHDITILGILYAINAEVLQTDERFWPPYGSHLAFELVRCGDESHVIRIVLNGQSLRSLEVGPDSMLRLADATRIVSNLETSGGSDYNAVSR
jgi:Histidine phosphatase superfamily (branch 2)